MSYCGMLAIPATQSRIETCEQRQHARERSRKWTIAGPVLLASFRPVDWRGAPNVFTDGTTQDAQRDGAGANRPALPQPHGPAGNRDRRRTPGRDTGGRQATAGPLEGMAGRGQPARGGLLRTVIG